MITLLGHSVVMWLKWNKLVPKLTNTQILTLVASLCPFRLDNWGKSLNFKTWINWIIDLKMKSLPSWVDIWSILCEWSPGPRSATPTMLLVVPSVPPLCNLLRTSNVMLVGSAWLLDFRSDFCVGIRPWTIFPFPLKPPLLRSCRTSGWTSLWSFTLITRPIALKSMIWSVILNLNQIHFVLIDDVQLWFQIIYFVRCCRIIFFEFNAVDSIYWLHTEIHKLSTIPDSVDSVLLISQYIHNDCLTENKINHLLVTNN